jgi:probable rRNA maturation factor
MIEINNLTKFAVDKKSFSQVAKKVLKGENRGTETLSLAFVGKEEIKRLNKKFRKKNKPTDVLSFEMKDGKFLGEVVICPEMVKPDESQRHSDGPATIPAERDLVRVFVHGILHLCGYDHEKSEKEAEVMEEKEKKYLAKF